MGVGEAGRGQKRPAAAAAADDPDSRKRARRLLGRALLGTLQKFQQEDAQFKVWPWPGSVSTRGAAHWQWPPS
jgi:hypothetical protein